MGSRLLNPRIHQMASFASQKPGDELTAQMEGLFAAQLIKAIQSTSDGSAEHPFRITCTADEYDVIAAMRKKPGLQALMRRDAKVLDRIHCDDGSILHFDITRPYHHLSQQMVNGP